MATVDIEILANSGRVCFAPDGDTSLIVWCTLPDIRGWLRHSSVLGWLYDGFTMPKMAMSTVDITEYHSSAIQESRCYALACATSTPVGCAIVFPPVLLNCPGWSPAITLRPWFRLRGQMEHTDTRQGCQLDHAGITKTTKQLSNCTGQFGLRVYQTFVVSHRKLNQAAVVISGINHNR